mmetsp:Transcript_963/g.2083  ORF Transcript_963/g.2083 Transcript_963/m.2083 type:complete len:229 (+) Transcript_963:137-823(+)
MERIEVSFRRGFPLPSLSARSLSIRSIFFHPCFATTMTPLSLSRACNPAPPSLALVSRFPSSQSCMIVVAVICPSPILLPMIPVGPRLSHPLTYKPATRFPPTVSPSRRTPPAECGTVCEAVLKGSPSIGTLRYPTDRITSAQSSSSSSPVGTAFLLSALPSSRFLAIFMPPTCPFRSDSTISVGDSRKRRLSSRCSGEVSWSAFSCFVCTWSSSATIRFSARVACTC